MRATFLKSPSETSRILPSFRFVFCFFEVRMCRVFVWPRLIFPVPVLLKRLAAPEWVFNFGIFFFSWFWRSVLLQQRGRLTGISPLFRPQSVYRKAAFGAR